MRDRAILSERAESTVPERQTEPGHTLVLVGGFPCQDLSIAGKQAGLKGDKSGLWAEFRRAIGEVRPDWIVIENVAHTWRRWVPNVRRDLWVAGYDSLPIRVRASDLGAPHQRARIFIVAHADCELLRKLSRWWVGPGREVAQQLVLDGADQFMADSAGIRRDKEYPVQSRGTKGSGTKGHRRGRSTGRGHGERRGWWSAEPDVDRVAYGLPCQVDRLTSLGNAVIPYIPQLIAKGIKEVSEEKCEACGMPATTKYDSQGEGYFWLCDRRDGDHGNDFYCGVEVSTSLSGVS